MLLAYFNVYFFNVCLHINRKKQKYKKFWEACTVAPPLEVMIPAIAFSSHLGIEFGSPRIPMGIYSIAKDIRNGPEHAHGRISVYISFEVYLDIS